MAWPHDFYRNCRAAWFLRETIRQTYPKGWWVGIADERIVADAASHDELVSRLRDKGYDPDRVVRAEAGVDAPVILSSIVGVPVE